MNKHVLEGLNKQLNMEFASAYVYLAMSSYYESIDLEGFSEWFKVKAYEEMLHAMKIYTYIGDRRGKRDLMPIPLPAKTWKSPLAAAEDAYKHECRVSESIHSILDIAREHKDHSTEAFLHWFVMEQIEEEAEADRILQKVRMVADNPGGLFMLDNYMMERAKADRVHGGKEERDHEEQ
ncbi:MAG: ferritin [Bacteroidota bacterium]|nr:ferritin [Candidatus Kapabacteria bacterium]MDW8221189.1 ferritin [Bacteroidota bacterium]